MNYSRKGVRERQRALNSKSAKWGRKLGLTALKLFLAACICVAIVGVATGIGMFKGIIASAPSISVDALIPKGQASIVYDKSGNEIDRFIGSNANRTIVTWDQVPRQLGLAFVAIEDERFYQHNGIDIKALFRAGYEFVRSHFQKTQGGSTITQQVLKNNVFTDWTSEGDNYIKKIKRKLQEQYLAIEVTKNTEKDQVLLAYMNTINCGQNTLGVEAASLRYFGKSCSELNLSECAVIASITNNPSGYNPIRHPEANARRRKDCLDIMKELGFITDAEYDEAIADTDAVYERIQTSNTAYLDSTSTTGTYFTDALQKQVQTDLVEELGMTESAAVNYVMSGGLKIYSTLDPDIQDILDEEYSNPDNFPANTLWLLDYAFSVQNEDGTYTNYSKENMVTWFKENVDQNFSLLFDSQEEGLEAMLTFEEAMAGDAAEDQILRRYSFTPQPQGSMTIIDQRTGYVVAMVGGRGSKEGRLTLNRATDSVRQPGSTFKVLAAYAPALDTAGMTLATVFNDLPFNYEGGRPVNNTSDKYDYRTVPIREAITRSMNIITVKTLTQIGPQLGYDYLLNFGFTSLTDGEWIGNEYYFDNAQPLALGGITHGVKNMELCAAYAAIANGGGYIKPKFYSKVVDSNGNVLLDNTAPQSRQVIRATTAYLLTSAMVDVVRNPRGTATDVVFPNMSIAGKTGTTTDDKDVWFAGFTPYYTCASWIGYDNNTKMTTAEKKLARKLWKAVMERVHEDLPNEEFAMPNGIVTRTVCSLSGKLPVPGLCDAYLKTEYFAESSMPTESCDMHYQGPICAYEGCPASPECPFQYAGSYNLQYITEDESLWSGYPAGIPQQNTNYCQHNSDFFANPDYQSILDSQRWEMEMRNAPPEDTPTE